MPRSKGTSNSGASTALNIADEMTSTSAPKALSTWKVSSFLSATFRKMTPKMMCSKVSTKTPSTKAFESRFKPSKLRFASNKA